MLPQNLLNSSPWKCYFVTAQSEETINCPLTAEQINILCPTTPWNVSLHHGMLAIKKNKVLTDAISWMILKNKLNENTGHIT